MWEVIIVLALVGAMFGLLALKFYLYERRCREWLRSLESTSGRPHLRGSTTGIDVRGSVTGESDDITGGGE